MALPLNLCLGLFAYLISLGSNHADFENKELTFLCSLSANHKFSWSSHFRENWYTQFEHTVIVAASRRSIAVSMAVVARAEKHISHTLVHILKRCP